MTATILHWPWRLDGSREWCQGLWRAQAGERVIEFFGTKPCAEWPVAEAQLLEQLQTALAAGAVAVIEGPPLVVTETANQAPAAMLDPVPAMGLPADGVVLNPPRSSTQQLPVQQLTLL